MITMNLTEFSRKGGRARQASLTPAQRREAGRKAASAYWARMAPKERSEELKRRAKARKA